MCVCVCVSLVYADFLHLRHQHLQESHYSLQRKFTLPGEDLKESTQRLDVIRMNVLERETHLAFFSLNNFSQILQCMRSSQALVHN